MTYDLAPEDRRVLERSSSDIHRQYLKGQYLNRIIKVMQGQADPNQLADELAEDKDKSDQEKIRDGLTGAFNRSYVGASLEREMVLARKYGAGLGFLFADLDHFKSVNDTEKEHEEEGEKYKGEHDAGDRTLKEMKKIMSEMVGPEVLIGRWGGEEWVMVIPDCDEEKLTEVARKLGETVKQTLARRAHLQKPEVTVSIGATLALGDEKATDLISRADKLAYEAKAGEGESDNRNRMVIDVPSGKKVEKFGTRAAAG